MITVGVDLGGTNTKTVVLDGERVIDDRSVPTDRSGAEAAVALVAAEACGALERHPGATAVGVTIPGHFDDAGRATIVPNIPGPWVGLPVRDTVARATGLPTVLVNDARAFGIAESGLGAARGSRLTVALVVGTGVGGAIVQDGRLLEGTTGLAGELGHTVLDPDGPDCGCGNRGCLEALVRSDRLAAAAGAESVEAAVRAADAGDPAARSALAAAGRWMGLALANAATLLAPDVIVIGGGVAASGETLLGPLRAEFRARTPLVDPASVRIVVAETGSRAGAIGAALAAARLGQAEVAGTSA